MRNPFRKDIEPRCAYYYAVASHLADILPVLSCGER